MPSDPYTAAIAALRDDSTLRVWSMIATAFGDLALRRGDAIAGPVLSALMAEMGIKPQATRVALHRLRSRDGWLASHRDGRTSRHSLSDKGRRESEAAATRIYRRAEDMPTCWHAVLVNSTSPEQMTEAGFAPLKTPRLFVGAAEVSPPPDALLLEPKAVPGWLGAEVEPPDLAADYAALHSRLMAAEAQDLSGLDPLHTATLRCLVVHGWRRLVLRHPDLPRTLYSDGWTGHDCRVRVHAILDRLPRPALADLHD